MTRISRFLRGPRAVAAGWLLVAWAGSTQGAAAAEITGRVEVVGRGAKLGRGGEKGTAVVYYEAETGSKAIAPAESYEMTMWRKRFQPGVLVVPRGAAVHFPNLDPILHNAFSISPGNRFDLGIYRRGPGSETIFDKPGVVRVFCNVHQSMIGYVVVVDTPHFALVDASGSFRLREVPPGRGRLTVWQERTGLESLKITVPTKKEAFIRIEANKRRLPSHLNKFGKPYARGRRGRY